MNGAFKVAGQILSAFSSIEGQIIMEAQLGAVAKCSNGEAGLCLLDAHKPLLHVRVFSAF